MDLERRGEDDSPDPLCSVHCGLSVEKETGVGGPDFYVGSRDRLVRSSKSPWYRPCPVVKR